jgi:AcrR family transcriptional regulator
MPDGKPMRADARRNRARILAAAEAVLARDGLAASVREIARQADVGMATIYRQFPTKEALYEAIIVSRFQALVEEFRHLTMADDAGMAFFRFFSRVVEEATSKKMLADALAAAGIDIEAGMPELAKDMTSVIETLLTRAQRARTVREDLALTELMALLTAACLAAERNQWEDTFRARILAVMFDGLYAKGKEGPNR